MRFNINKSSTPIPVTDRNQKLNNVEKWYISKNNNKIDNTKKIFSKIDREGSPKVNDVVNRLY